ncbi:hypothetical protein BJ508DRAFT_332419 [Ascobolus immersus RN42]|uniref:Uncharacterized protein n=1 Tax=Ascobolus immersus RN42 TaxID=1160509 RepID=A0A3N4HZR9_ASCIM|nr:hypothetical protein BJ508DRAFT_332419 [Ascobolus immersus RN42]
MADLLDVSPRLRQQLNAAMRSSDPRKRGKQTEDEFTLGVVVAFLHSLMEVAADICTDGQADTWLADEETITDCHLFFTFGCILIRSTNVMRRLGCILIDCGALISMTTMSIVKALDAVAELETVRDMSYRTAAGTVHAIRFKWRTVLRIASAKVKVTLFVSETEAPYAILLSRRFMKQSKMLGDYERDQYTMGDVHGRRMVVPRYDPQLKRPISGADIPVLVSLSPQLERSETNPFPAPMDPDMHTVSQDQSRRLVLQAAESLVKAVQADIPLLREDTFQTEDDEEFQSGKGWFRA